MGREHLPDHHIHSKASRCCSEKYTLVDIIAKLRELNTPYACITDHIHHAKDDQYFNQHIQIAKEFRAQNPDFPIFLGAEMTIQDISGHLPEQDQSKNKVQFRIVGDHYIPTTPITMEDCPGGGRFLKEWVLNNPSKLDHTMHIVKEMYLNCIKNNRPTVLVHPYSTFLRCDFAHEQFLTDLEQVCEVCLSTDTAIEINESQRVQCFVQNSPQIMEGHGILSKSDFFNGLIKIIKQSRVKYSLGSDSHLLKSVGHIDDVAKIATDYGLSEKNRIDLRDSIK